jgi:hypothetical protein
MTVRSLELRECDSAWMTFLNLGTLKTYCKRELFCTHVARCSTCWMQCGTHGQHGQCDVAQHVDDKDVTEDLEKTSPGEMKRMEPGVIHCEDVPIMRRSQIFFSLKRNVIKLPEHVPPDEKTQKKSRRILLIWNSLGNHTLAILANLGYPSVFYCSKDCHHAVSSHLWLALPRGARCFEVLADVGSALPAARLRVPSTQVRCG